MNKQFNSQYSNLLDKIDVFFYEKEITQVLLQIYSVCKKSIFIRICIFAIFSVIAIKIKRVNVIVIFRINAYG